jgi:2-hydroxy-3-keto-5-methylthiopentenyl-1-phosphate phosphatase
MTDNEIIKALECCSHSQHCSQCPYFHNDEECIKLEKYALDLINRQQAEIERETSLRQQWQEKCKEFLAEKQYIKAEAIKEFAERLKANRTKLLFSSTGFNKQIDNLVKEMVGED